jgi:putative acyl-CoA dehydrogenase
VALAFRLAQALDRSDDPREAALARIGLPLGKYLTSKRAPTVVAEAMECHGGAGYVEEGPMPRLFRQSPLNAIWEGSGNVIALDTLRALAREPEARDALISELRDAASANRDMGAIADEAETILSAPVAESAARHLAERLALALAAATLVKTAPGVVADAFIAGRCGASSITFGARTDVGDVGALISRLALQH